MLTDKRLVLTGIVTSDSIAYAVAHRAQAMGAEIILTAFPRDRPLTEAAAAGLPRRAEIVDLDVTREEDIARLTDHIRGAWGGLDGALHAVAFAPRDALAGDFLSASADGVNLAFQTSTFSYASLGRVLAGLAPESGGALVGIDFDAAGAWPVYNWMGVCKAALESTNRYLARDLGPRRVRSNLVAAGPIHTRAAGGITGFDRLLDAWDTRSPMPWDSCDPGPVADTICFLLSDLARAITGEIVHVDAGYHAMAGALRPSRVPSAAPPRDDPGTPRALAPSDTRHSTRELLLLAFSDLNSHGIAAQPALGVDPDMTRESLRTAILKHSPRATPSFIFWTADDDDCFDAQGDLQGPLTLHHSGADVARATRAALRRVGLDANDFSDQLHLVLGATG